MKRPSIYLANQLGFSEIGREYLDKCLKPRIEGLGISINDPFAECAKMLDLQYERSLRGYDERLRYWREFNAKLEPVNNALMHKSDAMAAILDGGHTVDDGVASEIGYFTGARLGPIFALRSDFRLAENIAASVNPQITGHIIRSGGTLVEGADALEQYFGVLRAWKRQYDAKQALSQLSVLKVHNGTGACLGKCHKH